MELPKNDHGRYRGQFVGYDDGRWSFSKKYGFGNLKRYDWEANLGLSLGLILDINNATEYNPGFLKALTEMVQQYPELLDFTIKFDGPGQPVRELLDSDGELVFYHGTSSTLWPTISQEGLRPREQTGSEPVHGDIYDAPAGRADAIYLTTQHNTAAFATHDAVRKFGGEPLIIRILDLDTSRLRPDEDSGETTVEGSIARIGSVAHVGIIPPEDLELV